MALVICVLAATALVAVGALAGSRRCAAALLALAPVWLLANTPVELTILWSMNHKHGLTLADLLVVPMIGLGAGRLRWPRRNPRPRRNVRPRRQPAHSARRPRLPDQSPS